MYSTLFGVLVAKLMKRLRHMAVRRHRALASFLTSWVLALVGGMITRTNYRVDKNSER
jgi:uncharacterized membrane protein